MGSIDGRRAPGCVCFVRSVRDFPTYARRLYRTLQAEYGEIKCLTAPKLLADDVEVEQIPDYPFVPAIAHTLRFKRALPNNQERLESWYLSMHATNIPFVHLFLEIANPPKPAELPEVGEFLFRLFEDGQADFASIRRGELFFGMRWAMYLMFKIDSSPRLSHEMITARAANIRADSLLVDLMTTLRHVFATKGYGCAESVLRKRKRIRAFLDECDCMIEEMSHEVNPHVFPFGWSLKEWLAIGY
jgi:hypothetical protein